MESNNKNITLVKSLIQCFRLSELNQVVVFDLSNNHYRLIRDFTEFSWPSEYETAHSWTQMAIRDSTVVLDCRQSVEVSDKIATFIVKHSDLRLPLYISTPTEFLFVAPSLLIRKSSLNFAKDLSAECLDVQARNMSHISKTVQQLVLDADVKPKIVRSDLFAYFVLEEPVL